MKSGIMANDTLRQLKNMGICSATLASRISIEGGLNIQTAFHLSDLYIQKLEILRDSIPIYALIEEMAEEFGISRSRLSSQFHEQTGITLRQYILNEKVLESQRLLQFT